MTSGDPVGLSTCDESLQVATCTVDAVACPAQQQHGKARNDHHNQIDQGHLSRAMKHPEPGLGGTSWKLKHVGTFNLRSPLRIL